jgi:hypothetical protein
VPCSGPVPPHTRHNHQRPPSRPRSNALNLIPAGELDGAKTVLGLYGRRASTAVSLLTTAALAFSAATGNSLSFAWVRARSQQKLSPGTLQTLLSSV